MQPVVYVQESLLEIMERAFGLWSKFSAHGQLSLSLEHTTYLINGVAIS